MQPILNPQQIREVDNFTCQHQHISSLQLMDRACRAIVDWLLAKYPYIALRRVVVVAGSGGNGGDALGVAAALALMNVTVEVYRWTEDHRSTPDNLSMLERVRQHNVPIHENELPNECTNPRDILLDGVLGFGAKGGIAEELAMRIYSYCNVVSIDLPSGVMADGSFSSESAVHADYTLAIQLPKLAYFLPECDECIGELEFLNIDLDTSCADSPDMSNFKIIDDSPIFGDSKRPRACYKGDFGHVLSITGSDGMMGASVLSSKAALRSGTGLLTAVIPDRCTEIMQISLPEAMVYRRECLDDLFPVTPRKPYTIVIGSGLANEADSELVLNKTLAFAKKNDFPVVVDATSIRDLKNMLIYKESLPVDNMIITPHVGEFDALVGPSKTHLERLKKAMNFSKEYNCVVVLKNFRTAVVYKDEVYFCQHGNPGMATAGSGDVLAGVIAGVIASEGMRWTSVCKAVSLHSRAGDMAAQSISERALIASDIIEGLKHSF